MADTSGSDLYSAGQDLDGEGVEESDGADLGVVDGGDRLGEKRRSQERR
jgi:hypothetical protein